MVFMIIGWFFVRLTRTFQNRFNFVKGQYRKISRKQQEECEKQSDGTDAYSNINMTRIMHAPSSRNIVTMNRCYNDHVSFKPHTDVYDDGDKEGKQQTPSQLSYPHKLWRNYITGHHRPISPPIRTGSSVQEGICLVFYTWIPRDKEFRYVCSTNDRTSNHDHNVHILHMLRVDICLQLHRFTHY